MNRKLFLLILVAFIATFSLPGCFKQQVIVEKYKINVSYGTSLDQMIELGKYYQVDPICLEFKIPTQGKSVVTVELLQFPEKSSVGMGYHLVLAVLKSKGYRPVDYAELLALGEQYPDLQLHHVIVAYGETLVKEGQIYCPSLEINLGFSAPDGSGGGKVRLNRTLEGEVASDNERMVSAYRYAAVKF